MLKKIVWNNHNILGNLELNFLKSDGLPYSTIVLAGENGVGKTTILETLTEFLNLGTIRCERIFISILIFYRKLFKKGLFLLSERDF